MQITMSEIKKEVCDYFQVTPFYLGAKSRKKVHSHPRKVYMYLCRTLVVSTLREIGESINRDHATVYNGVTDIESRMLYESGKTKNQVEELTGLIKAKAQARRPEVKRNVIDRLEILQKEINDIKKEIENQDLTYVNHNSIRS